MLFKCTTNAPGEGRIPSTLLHTYVQYKQDTKVVIGWLVSHGTGGYGRMRALSIRDLFSLADSIKAKAVQMPDTIDFHFREAIAARRQLSKHFRKHGAEDQEEVKQDTVNHEFFTTSLAKIHASLCESCVKPRQGCAKIHHCARSRKSAIALPNRFTALGAHNAVHGCSSDDEGNHYPHEPKVTDRKGKGAPKDPLDYSLAGDALGEAFEFIKEIQEMNDLLDAASNAWEQAAQGGHSIIVATLITNVIYAAFESIESHLKQSSNVSDPAALLNRFDSLAQSIGLATNEEKGPRPVVQKLLESLQVSWQQLLGVKVKGPAKHRDTGPLQYRSPSELVLRRGKDSKSADDECLPVMLQNIVQYIQSSYLGNNILRVGTPVYPEVGYFMTHDGTNLNGLRCSYGLEMLLASYKSYLFALEAPHGSMNCRLQALKFAQEGLSSIDAVLGDSTMPCRCHGTLAYHLQDLRQDFHGFLAVNRFDFYFQSPWVCGCHMLEMSDALFYYGLRLFNYRSHVGSFVHVYNVLRQFTDLKPIPLLENLRHTFCESLFPGGQPARNFRACYIRFMGGRLRFKSHASNHKSGCHSMEIPAHTAAVTAGFGSRSQVSDPRFGYRKVSCFYHVKEKGYHLNDQLWNRIDALGEAGSEDDTKSQKSRPCSHHGHPGNGQSSCSAQHRYTSLQKAVLAEFTGPFPVARINLLQVYLVCVQVISKISDRHHGDDERPGLNCLCFVEPLLAAGDRCRDGRHELQPFGCKDLVRICREAMTETLGGRGVDEFVWEGI